MVNRQVQEYWMDHIPRVCHSLEFIVCISEVSTERGTPPPPSPGPAQGRPNTPTQPQNDLLPQPQALF